MSDANSALLRAWKLGIADWCDQVEAEIETLLPTLVEAGYASAEEHLWRFTPAGVARAEELGV